MPGRERDGGDVLAAWTTLEVLTPQPLPDAEDLLALRRRRVSLRDPPEPWKDPGNGKQAQESAVHWFVYLGQIEIDTVKRSLLQLFPDDQAEERAA
ncbi:MAG TPA: hypothetical protein VHB68_19645, partial [Steroidobacteraceae bacterium]|nr:hypothetical protein [Steroidobacteraceae bacterium]